MKKFKDMRISAKLMLSFLSVTLISSILIGSVGLANLMKVSAQGRAVYTENLAPLEPIHEAYSDYLRMRMNVRQSVLEYYAGGDILAVKQTIDDLYAKAKTYLADYEDNISSAEERSNYETIQDDLEKYYAFAGKQISYVLAGKPEEAIEMTKGAEIKAISAELDSCMQKAFDLNIDQAKARNADNASSVVFSIIVMIAVVAVAILLSMLLGAAFARNMTRSIKVLQRTAKSIEQGSIDQAIVQELTAASGKDELGELASSMRIAIHSIEQLEHDAAELAQAMAANDLSRDIDTSGFVGVYKNIMDTSRHLYNQLSSTMASIGTVAGQVSSGATMVSNGAQSIAQGATEQASSVEELSSVVANVVESAQNNVESINMCNEYIHRSGTDLQVSTGDMDHLLAAMHEINDSSSQISGIIKIIDDISFQTNILALNASVEAARAGDAGRGFAVVADEVRVLALKSADAAKQTADLIETSIRSISRGTGLAESTSHSLSRVADNSAGLAKINEDIMHSLHEQANALGEIKIGLEQISGVIQSNSAAAEESASASEQLSAQAQTLYNDVSKFRLKTNIQ